MTENPKDNSIEEIHFEKNKKLLEAARNIGEPITGSLALMVQTGNNLEDALSKAGDIDVVLTDQANIDQVYEKGLEEVPCNSEGWTNRVIEMTVSGLESESPLKMVHWKDIVTSMVSMWVDGRLDQIQPLHRQKIEKQLDYLQSAMSWAERKSDGESSNFIQAKLSELNEWVDSK